MSGVNDVVRCGQGAAGSGDHLLAGSGDLQPPARPFEQGQTETPLEGSQLPAQ